MYTSVQAQQVTLAKAKVINEEAELHKLKVSL